MKQTKYLSLYAVGFTCWLTLILVRAYEIIPSDIISKISAQVEIFLHAAILIISSKLYLDAVNKDRKIFFWLLLTNLGLFLNELFFYFIVYFLKNYHFNLTPINYTINMIFSFSWNIAILICLFNLIKNVFTFKKFTQILSVLMLLDVAIIFLFFDSVPSTFYYLSWQNILQIVSSLLELIIYNLCILCLIYSVKKGLSFIVVGLIILISGDFIISYSFLAQTNFIATYGELLWFLGIFCFFFGIINLKYKNNDHSWLRAANSIKGSLAFWAFGISIINVLPSFGLAYLFYPLNKELFLVLPPFLMITSVLTVLISLFTAKHFETPFKKITNNIECLMLNGDKNKFNNYFVIDEFIFLQEFILNVFDLKKEKEAAEKTLISLAAQVAHDIRSPLLALNVCLKHLPQTQETYRVLMRNASNRINDIANNLLQIYFDNKRDTAILNSKVWLLAPILESIISEKRVQFEDRSIELELLITREGFSAFAKFDLSRMKRLLSNLINNALESFSTEDGKIILILDTYDGKIFLKIIDNGSGIEVKLLDKVLSGMSLKDNGFGLGLPDAKKSIESFGGTLQLHSILTKGTTVEIILPYLNPPDWFLSEIYVSPNTKIGILDDDQSVHDAWDIRLLSVSKKLSIYHFKTISSFLNWYDAQSKPVQIFSDHELLGESETGLDILERRQLGNTAILVTSHYENLDVIDRCQKIGVRLLPKNLLAHVPIKIY